MPFPPNLVDKFTPVSNYQKPEVGKALSISTTLSRLPIKPQLIGFKLNFSHGTSLDKQGKILHETNDH